MTHANRPGRPPSGDARDRFYQDVCHLVSLAVHASLDRRGRRGVVLHGAGSAVSGCDIAVRTASRFVETVVSCEHPAALRDQRRWGQRFEIQGKRLDELDVGNGPFDIAVAWWSIDDCHCPSTLANWFDRLHSRLRAEGVLVLVAATPTTPRHEPASPGEPRRLWQPIDLLRQSRAGFRLERFDVAGTLVRERRMETFTGESPVEIYGGTRICTGAPS